jgi:Transposase zinc-binding domain
MRLLSSIIETFEADLLESYQDSLLPSHRQALTAMKRCRTTQSPVMLAECDDCASQVYVPHSGGHRNCPHCQQHESQQWLERQLQKRVPAEYFLVTFTAAQGTPVVGLAAATHALFLNDTLRLGDTKNFHAERPAAQRQCRRHYGIAHPFAPSRLSSACALCDTGSSYRYGAALVANENQQG